MNLGLAEAVKPFLAVLNDFVTIELDAIGMLSKTHLSRAHRTRISPDGLQKSQNSFESKNRFDESSHI